MNSIKDRRLHTAIPVYPDLMVGQCVPFYFCPRSVMLYLLYQGNHPELGYRGGQNSIIHLQADLYQVIDWANRHNKRWAFTLSNAGSSYFEARKDVHQLHELDWEAIDATHWQSCKEGKQAEFLFEHSFPWTLIESIGVKTNDAVYNQVCHRISSCTHQPQIHIQPNWYY